MRMRKIAMLTVLMVCGVVVPSPAMAETLLEKVLTVVIADRFGIDPREVVEIRRDTKPSFESLGETLAGSYYMNAQAREVARLRKQGLGWGQIAHKIGMHPGTFNKLRNSGAFDAQRAWTGAISQRFGTKTEDVTRVMRSGGSLSDVLASVVIAKATGKSPQTVYESYKTVKDWDRVEDRYKVNLDDWKNYAVAAKPPAEIEVGAPSPSAPGKGKGKGKGKGGG